MSIRPGFSSKARKGVWFSKAPCRFVLSEEVVNVRNEHNFNRERSRLSTPAFIVRKQLAVIQSVRFCTYKKQTKQQTEMMDKTAEF